MKKFEVLLEREKETKNTWRYRAVEAGAPSPVDAIYIKKWILGDPPEMIKITVEEATD